jgi:hypothetical protein
MGKKNAKTDVEVPEKRSPVVVPETVADDV